MENPNQNKKRPISSQLNFHAKSKYRELALPSILMMQTLRTHTHTDAKHTHTQSRVFFFLPQKADDSGPVVVVVVEEK